MNKNVMIRDFKLLHHYNPIPDGGLPQEHIYRHSFDIKSGKVFSFVAGIGIVCAVSLWGNIELWQSKRQYSDDAQKFRVIRAWGGCDANDVLWLNRMFDIHRDGKAVE